MKLEGVRVLDLSLFLPGPHLTQIMADHGADVIKIEPPGAGEPVRNVGYRAGGESVWFRNTHRGKRSVVLDLKSDAGREALLKLAETCDVMIEAFRPGVVDRLGVGYQAVSKRHPGIVYASMAAFGQTGPEHKRPAHDIAIQALAGTVSLNLGNDGAPTNPHIPVADMSASLMTLAGIVMALLRRQTTGQGDFLDMSMQDSLMAWLPNVTGPVFAENRAPLVKSERSFGGNAFFAIYPTRDDLHVVLGGVEEKFVVNLLTALERTDLIDIAMQPPGPAQQQVKDFLTETFKTRTRGEWEIWFKDMDVCFAPVLNLHEAFHRPQVEAREMLLTDDDGNLHIGLPIKYRNEPGQANFTLPDLGAHTADVLREADVSEEDISAILKP